MKKEINNEETVKRTFEIKMNFRLELDTHRKIVFLLKNFPDKYLSESHLIRCAIIQLYNHELEGLKEK